MNKSIITNKITVNEKEYDCDGPFFRQVQYGNVSCPNCGDTRRIKVHYFQTGDGMICNKCKSEFIIVNR